MGKHLNKVILIGNLGRDPDVKFTDSGRAVCNFSVATNEKWKDREGNQQERTEWHKIVAWGKLAEICGEYLSKGKMVYIEGSIQSRKWEDRDGAERTTYEIKAWSMIMLGGRSDSDSQGDNQGGDDSSNDSPPPPPDYGPEDDVPF